ncbi:MAG TPA: hypothetical protein VIJ00_01110 [Nakamurella sp.]
MSGPGHEPLLGALGKFAQGTRRYFGVATILGGIVAVLPGIGPVILGIPAAGLWALLAFITNDIPNVGFIIGLIPSAATTAPGTTWTGTHLSDDHPTPPHERPTTQVAAAVAAQPRAPHRYSVRGAASGSGGVQIST